MIFFGTRGVTYSKNRGEVSCPNCQSQRAYSHQRVRRFFTLYFIPTIPLDLHGEYIECQRCDNAYDLEVLNLDPQAGNAEFEAEFHQAIKRTMVAMMIADGAIEDSELEVIQGVYQNLTGIDLSNEVLEEEIRQAKGEGRDVTNTLADIVGYLNNAGKEMVIKAAFLIAVADGEIQDEEELLIGQIARSLEMSNAHLQGVLDSMMEGS